MDYKQFAIDNARMQAEPQRYEMEALAWKKLALRLAQEAAAVLDNAHWEVKFGSGDLVETLKQVREQSRNTEGDSLIAALAIEVGFLVPDGGCHQPIVI